MRQFARHYVEMVLAMFAGMLVLGMPAAWAVGLDTAGTDRPALRLFGMALTMTVPMVAWMRYRGHGWRPCNEMSAAMLLPTFVAIALLPVVAYGTLMAVEHVAMLALMLVAMLLRPEEYMHHDHSHEVIA
jgi:hypothetical protein